MKVSNIACALLLGSCFIVSDLLATPLSDYEDAIKAKEDAIALNKKIQRRKENALNSAVGQMKFLLSVKELKEWDGYATNPDPQKAKIYKKMYDASQEIGDALYVLKPTGSPIVIKADDQVSILSVLPTGDIMVSIKSNGGSQVYTGDMYINPFYPMFITPSDMAFIFHDKNIKVWWQFLKGFDKKHAELVNEREKALSDNIKNTLDPAIKEKALALANLGITTTDPKYSEGVVKNFDALDDTLRKDISEKEDALDRVNKKVDQKISEIDGSKVILEKKDLEGIKAQEAKIDAAKARVDSTLTTSSDKREALLDAIKAGIPVVKDGKRLTQDDVKDSTKLADSDLDGVITTTRSAAADAKSEVSTVTTLEASDVLPAKAALESAKETLVNFEKKIANDTKKIAKDELKACKDSIDPHKTGSEAEAIANAKVAKKVADQTFATSIDSFQIGPDKDKVVLLGASAEAIAKQFSDITNAKNALSTAAYAGSDAKRDAIKKAIEAGVPVEHAGKKLSIGDVENLSIADLNALITTSTSKANDAQTALSAVNASAVVVVAQDTIIKNAIKAIADQRDRVKQTSNVRAKSIARSNSFGSGESDVLIALSDILDSNDKVANIFINEDSGEIAGGAKDLHSTLEHTIKYLNRGDIAEILLFNADLATNTRLAKLSNPYNENLALAYAIKNMNGEKFADNSDETLSSLVKEHANSYKYDHNLWGSTFGGKVKSKDSANTDTYGFTLGYDKAFDNAIVGSFLLMARSKSNEDNMKNDANSYGFGVYARRYLDQKELNAKFLYGFTRNTLATSSSLIGGNDGKYGNKFFDISVDYGYVFDLEDAKFIKPMLGIECTNLKNDSFTTGGAVDINFARTNVRTLSVKAATEFRVYTNEGDYFYITPGIQSEINKSADDGLINFADSRDVTFDIDKRRYTYFTLKTGAEFRLTNALNININFGAKAGSKTQLYNGAFGLSYKF